LDLFIFSVAPKGVCKAAEPPYLHFGSNSLTRQALAHMQGTHPGSNVFQVHLEAKTMDLAIVDFNI